MGWVMQELVYSLNYVLECGLNEELGRHRGREGKYMCNLCSEDCESVGHFLWNCPIYSERRALFLEHLKNNLGNEFEHFKSCDIAGKSHFILGTELWGSCYEELLRLVKSYIIDIWELRKSKLYGSGTGPLQYRSRPGRDTACQGKGKFGKLGGEKSCIVVYGSARSFECDAMAQVLRLPFEYYIYIIIRTKKTFKNEQISGDAAAPKSYYKWSR